VVNDDEEVLVLNAKTVQPGDVVVLETAQAVSADQAQMLKERLCERMPFIKPDDVVILSGMHLTVVRPPAE
jgi:hypothetical protein